MAGRSWGVMFVTLGLVAGGSRTSTAQGATFTVQARVFQPITVLASRDLAFGSVFPGVNKTVPVTGGSSGRYQLSGEANASISLTFTLPANLVNGANLLPINTWVGRHNTISNAATGVSFTPSGSPTNTQFSATGQRFVFISATVSPAANLAPGGYVAVATLTVAYL